MRHTRTQRLVRPLELFARCELFTLCIHAFMEIDIVLLYRSLVSLDHTTEIVADPTVHRRKESRISMRSEA